jgi:hypothetical protein
LRNPITLKRKKKKNFNIEGKWIRGQRFTLFLVLELA